MLRRFTVGILVAAAFLVGFSGLAEAWPIKGRDPHRGYFTNVLDQGGTDVFPVSGGRAGCQGDGVNALPASVNSRQNFINFVKCKLGGNNQERTGAAFIIQTMIGVARNRPPTAAQIAEWESRVLNPALQFRWNTVASYTVNSFYQATGVGPNPIDDAFYNESGSSPAVIFGSGANAYIIRRQCANPVGNGTLPTLPDPVNFNMQGRTTANRTTVGPGQTIVFDHYLRNNGTTATDRDIWWLGMSQPGNVGLYSANSGRYNPGQEKHLRTENYVVPINTPVGTQICRNIRWEPDTQNGGLVYGNTVCVQVTALYTLTPSVQASTATAQEGDQVTFTYFVTNSGPTPSGQTNCKPVGNTRAAGHTPLPMQDSDRNSDAGYSPPNTSCPRVFPYSHASGATNPPVNIGSETVTVSNIPTGSMLCRSLVVNPMNQAGGIRASAERCVLIVKSPTVHFMGGDIAVGNPYNSASATCSLLPNSGNIYTTANQRGGGSTVEYAAFVRGMIQFLQSSGYGFGTASRVGVDNSNIRKLSFANTQSDAGNFGSNECITDYYSKYSAEIPTTGSPGTRTLSGSDTRHYSGNLTINGSNITNGARILIVVDGNVTITGPIRYSGNYANTDQIPSVAIIAGGNITVNNGATQLDGAYISKGTIHTCDNTSGALTTSICQQQLTLNGVLMTDQLNLRRTFGADSSNFEEPAERFNFTTEMFFNNVLDDEPDNRVETVEQRDLPPRY